MSRASDPRVARAANGENFEPSPEAQEVIDEVLEQRRRERKKKDWSSGRGIVLDPAAIRHRLAERHPARSMTSSHYPGLYYDGYDGHFKGPR